MGEPRPPPTLRGSIHLLVVQPTPFCNINCSYCYLPDRSSTRSMSLDTVRLLARRVVQDGWAGSDATVVWHAGEPLVVPVEWYEQAFEILGEHCPPGVRLTHAVQTNGTLINARWVALFQTYDMRVGVSLDGPREFHDHHRKARNGQGTFERTMRGIRLLQDAGLPFHVITVLTEETLRHADGLFDFYISEGIKRVCFNIEEIEGANGRSSLAASNGETLYRDFLRRFISRARYSSHAIWVREVASSIGTILAAPADAMRNFQVEPLSILTVDVDGNLSTFSPELAGTLAPAFADFRFANLHTGGPEALLASPAFGQAHAAIRSGVERCRATCAWFRWCNGGAPANKLFENGSLDSGETM
jgi:uncharacterized protein